MVLAHSFYRSCCPHVRTVTMGRTICVLLYLTGHFGEAESVDSDVQYSAALEYCREQNYSPSENHISVEECEGEELRVSPALNRLPEDARRREFDVVVVYSYGCLAREEALIIDLSVFLAQDGVRIESVKSIA